MPSNVVHLNRLTPPPAPKPSRPKADLWPKVQERFIKLGKYGLCGMQPEKPDRLPKDVKDFLTVMQFIPVATPTAAKRLWDKRDVCKTLINIRNNAKTIEEKTFQKIVEINLITYGIKAVFDSLANNHFGIYRFFSKDAHRQIEQHVEESDFINARAVFLESDLRFKMLGLNHKFNERQSMFLHWLASGIDGRFKIIQGDRMFKYYEQGRTNLVIGRQLLESSRLSYSI